MSVPPPQLPYGAPSPDDGNPYATGNPYGRPTPPPPPGPPPGYGYPAAPPPPDQPYGYPPQPAPGYGYGYPPPAPQDGPACRFCGGFPAVDATVRGHQGLVLAYRMLRMPGPFCRTCGTATVRDLSARTLVQGWWSPASVLLAPITLLLNLAANGKVKRLPPPVPGSHGPQLDPGVPLGRRPHALMLLLPLSVVVTLVLAATGVLGPKDDGPAAPIAVPTVAVPPVTTFSAPPLPTHAPRPFPSPTFSMPPVPTITLPPPTAPSTAADSIDRANPGDCLRNENGTGATHDANPKITMLPCGDSRAQYKVVFKYLATSDEKVCEKQPKSDSTYTRTYSNLPALNYVLCLQSLHG
ncbi:MULTISPECIES: hypothetical protein [unclassified Kitasatospora]|uniref:LppU/SCO3897 family protein n=1 Tax=unclassified Kitasatospora TaxID=2633591 RepID=UPI00342B0EBC